MKKKVMMIKKTFIMNFRLAIFYLLVLHFDLFFFFQFLIIFYKMVINLVIEDCNWKKMK
jgi:hypothetical protein